MKNPASLCEQMVRVIEARFHGTGVYSERATYSQYDFRPIVVIGELAVSNTPGGEGAESEETKAAWTTTSSTHSFVQYPSKCSSKILIKYSIDDRIQRRVHVPQPKCEGEAHMRYLPVDYWRQYVQQKKW